MSRPFSLSLSQGLRDAGNTNTESSSTARGAEPALSVSGKHSGHLARDAALVEHIKASGAKNPEKTTEKLVEEKFEKLSDLLDVGDLLEILTKTCDVKGKSADKIIKYCSGFR